MARPRTVLIVDPCRLSAATLAEVLDACGHPARTAGTAAEALALAAAGLPDVLVTEAVLPDGPGSVLAAAVRRLGGGRPRLVLLTAWPTGGAWPGFDLVLAKPADPEAVVRFVGGEGPSSRRAGRPNGPRPDEGRRTATPEERAAEFVAVACSDAGVPKCVELRGPGLPPYPICHSPNPARVREAAEAVRAFVAAVLRAAGPPG